MTSPRLLGLAAIVVSTLATPAFAQTTVDNSGRCTGLFQDPNCQTLGPANSTTDRTYRRHHMARNQVNPDDGRQSGFWPLDTAGAVAGAAVGTAAAVAAAPFQERSKTGGWRFHEPGVRSREMLCHGSPPDRVSWGSGTRTQGR